MLLISRLFQSIVISHFTFHYLLHLGCIGYGGVICRIKEAKLCSLSGLRDERFLPFAFIFYFAFKVAITRGRVSKLLHEKSVLKNSDFRAPKTKSVGCLENSGSHAQPQPQPPYSRNSNSVREEALCFQFVATDYRDLQQETKEPYNTIDIQSPFNSFNFISRRTQENFS